MLVVRLAVHARAGAVAGVVDDCSVKRPNLYPDRQHVIRIVGILGRHDHVVVGHDQGRAVLRPGLEHDRFVVALGRRQVVFVDQDHVTAGVGEDRRPAVAVDVVNRVLFDDFERMPRDRLAHQVEVVAVLHQEDAAVEDLHAVVAVFGPASQHDAVAVGRTGQHARARRSDLEQAAVNVMGPEIDHRQVSLQRVGDQQPADGLGRAVIVVVHLLIVVTVFCRHCAEWCELVSGVLDRFGQIEDVLGVLNDRILVRRFESGPVDDHQVCFRDRSDVRHAQLKRVGVCAGGNQRSDFDVFATDLSDPVSDHLRRDHDVQWLARDCLWLRLLFLLLLR